MKGCRAFQFERFPPKVDQFFDLGGGGRLGGGRAFMTYAQRLNFQNIQNSAFLASVHLLKTNCAPTH